MVRTRLLATLLCVARVSSFPAAAASGRPEDAPTDCLECRDSQSEPGRRLAIELRWPVAQATARSEGPRSKPYLIDRPRAGERPRAADLPKADRTPKAPLRAAIAAVSYAKRFAEKDQTVELLEQAMGILKRAWAVEERPSGSDPPRSRVTAVAARAAAAKADKLLAKIEQSMVDSVDAAEKEQEEQQQQKQESPAPQTTTEASPTTAAMASRSHRRAVTTERQPNAAASRRRSGDTEVVQPPQTWRTRAKDLRLATNG